MQNLIKPGYTFLKNNVYPITFGFCIVCTVIMLYIKGVLIYSYHPDISGSERCTSFGIQIVADNQVLYRNPEVEPFWIVQYSPLYLYLVGKMYDFLNWDITNIYRVQFLSRVISFVLVSLSIVIAFITVQRFLGLSKMLSIIFCCLLFAQLQQWHLTNGRIDSLLFLCTVVFVYLMLCALEEKTAWNKYFVFASFVAILAFYSKQSGMIHSLVLLGYFFYRLQWLSLLKAFGCLLLFFSPLLLIFSRLEFLDFYNNLFGSLKLPMVAGWFYSYTFKQLIPAVSPFIAVSFIISINWLVKSAEPKTIFLSLSTFLFFGFATATAFKHGAAVGYYHEFVYVALVGLFYYFYNENAVATRSSMAYYLVPAMMIMTMIFFTSQQLEKLDWGRLEEYRADHLRQKTVQQYVDKRIRDDEKVVINGGPDFRGWPLEHMLFRHVMAYQGPEVRFLYKSKTFNYQGFNELVKNGKVKFLILDKNSPPYFDALDYTFNLSDYLLETVIGGYRIYRLNK